MKKIILILFTLPFFGFANSSDLFKVDNNKINSYMQNINEIESYVQENQDDYNSSVDFKPELFSNINSTASFSLVYGEPPLGIPSFVWGLCCGISGLAVVYFVTDDTEETKKALYGCATSTVVGGIVYFAAFATTAATY
ncbi:MAG: hypothetical protein CMJ05_09825 [Pelagibacterales bacterium]|nr:hypothetical protein [Pelagibacterales bacterium]|tara:strand:+ start:1844 stop:2260 length:417 start_codon:yes stop_codon:yes gene_type:complete